MTMEAPFNSEIRMPKTESICCAEVPRDFLRRVRFSARGNRSTLEPRVLKHTLRKLSREIRIPKSESMPNDQIPKPKNPRSARREHEEPRRTKQSFSSSWPLV